MCQSRGFRGISHAPHKCSSAWLFHGPPDRHILPACPVRAETGKPAGTDTDFGFAHLLYAGSPYQLTLVVRYRLRGALPRTPAVPKSLPCVHGTQGAYLQKEAVVLLQVKQDHACERLNATCAKVNATASSDSSIYFFNSRLWCSARRNDIYTRMIWYNNGYILLSLQGRTHKSSCWIRCEF